MLSFQLSRTICSKTTIFSYDSRGRSLDSRDAVAEGFHDARYIHAGALCCGCPGRERGAARILADLQRRTANNWRGLYRAPVPSRRLSLCSDVTLRDGGSFPDVAADF